jgi:hypothetical protein
MYTALGKIKQCWKSHRSVAHLWAAVVLHAQGFMPHSVPHLPDLMTTRDGQRMLLATARPVQAFARGYRDPATARPVDFGPSPWWVPDGLYLPPAWKTVEPRPWLLQTVRNRRA